MEVEFKSTKLNYCKDELKTLPNKLIEGGYHQTAEVVFDHIAHTGVETDLDKSLKKEPTLNNFLKKN